MLKGNCQKKNLTTCERKISSYRPASTERDYGKTNVLIRLDLRMLNVTMKAYFCYRHALL